MEISARHALGSGRTRVLSQQFVVFSGRGIFTPNAAAALGTHARGVAHRLHIPIRAPRACDPGAAPGKFANGLLRQDTSVQYEVRSRAAPAGAGTSSRDGFAADVDGRPAHRRGADRLANVVSSSAACPQTATRATRLASGGQPGLVVSGLSHEVTDSDGARQSVALVGPCRLCGHRGRRRKGRDATEAEQDRSS